MAARRALEAVRALNAIATRVWGGCGGEEVFTRHKRFTTRLNGRHTISPWTDKRNSRGNFRQCCGIGLTQAGLSWSSTRSYGPKRGSKTRLAVGYLGSDVGHGGKCWRSVAAHIQTTRHRIQSITAAPDVIDSVAFCSSRETRRDKAGGSCCR